LRGLSKKRVAMTTAATAVLGDAPIDGDKRRLVS
jgi:hypothetical protein